MVETFKILKSLEYFLIFVTIICAGYIGYFFMFKSKSIDLPPSISRVKEEPDSPQEDVIQSLLAQSFETYDSQIKARDIFSAIKPVVVKPEDKVNVAPTGQLPPNLKVVGIVLSNPTQLVIEDQTARQTYFIDQGHDQAGISIQRVENNIIYIKYQNQTIEIPLKGSQINVSSPTT